MNFLRKLFTQTEKKNIDEDKNEFRNLNTTELVGHELPLHTYMDIVSNIQTNDNIVINNENKTKDDDSSVTHTINNDTADKIMTTLQNIPPIVIHPNSNSDIKPNEIELNDNIVPIEDILNESTFNTDNSPLNTVLDSVTLQLLSKTNIHPKQIHDVTDDLISKEVVSNHISHNNETNTFENIIDDETLQNLKEFEATLNNFDKTACVNDSGGDLINLDEFNDIFDDLESLKEDSNSKSSPVKCINDHSGDKKDTNNNETNSEMNSINTNNNDIISITSSTEGEICQADDLQDQIVMVSDSDESLRSECDGYNSSDFEFISENEAHMDGFIINYRSKINQKHDNISQASSELSTFSGQFRERENHGDTEKDDSDPEEGPSGINRPRHEFQDRSYRNNHSVPVGEGYLGLFQGIYNPLLPACEIFFMENKSIRASAMNVQYDGMGFDKQLALRRPQPDSSEDEFEDEAKACAKKILNMYPGENRKRRRS